MEFKTRVFELADQKYLNLTELAKAMKMSISEIYRVRQGKRGITTKFIIGALKAFPDTNSKTYL